MKLYQYTLHGWVNPADVFISLFGNDEYAFWLDRERHATSRFSVIGHAYGGAVATLAQARQEVEAGITDFASEADFVSGFMPGFVGWIDYPETVLPSYVDNLDALPATLLEVREALVFDHDRRHLSLVGRFETEEAFEHWVQGILLRLALAGGEQASFKHRNKPGAVTDVSLRHSRDEYLALIEKAKSHIAAGDIYQLCLTNEVTLKAEVNPLEVFLRLRAQSSAPYSSFIRAGSKVLVSASPEQFLSISADGLVQTKPIKGTRPRSQDAAIDAQLANELAFNEKERAENLMIVDLMRNDLSKFSVQDSVQVAKLFDVESYASVHQLVSTVQSQLADDENPIDALVSAFPGGSMTGAPKLRAQQLISEFENGERGVYSGISGIIGLDGSVEMSMNIRCLVFEGGQVRIGVGGGITADSDPQAEFDETKLKAQSLLSVLGTSWVW